MQEQDSESDSPAPLPKKQLRSSESISANSTTGVLHKCCIICKTQKYGWRSSSAYGPQKLHLTETIGAGRLREAAEVTGDTRLLMHLSGDCVAKEVRYHNSCRTNYILSAFARESGGKPASLPKMTLYM